MVCPSEGHDNKEGNILIPPERSASGKQLMFTSHSSGTRNHPINTSGGRVSEGLPEPALLSVSAEQYVDEWTVWGKPDLLSDQYPGSGSEC